jgi:Glycine zipper
MNYKNIALLSLLTMTVALNVGCSNAGEGALSGAGIGALSGLAIGSFSGNAGAGAAIGAVAGGVGGAVIGDQNRRRAEEAAAQQPPPPQPVVVQPYYTGSALNSFVGSWNITGVVYAGPGQSQAVSGTANATIDKVFYVRIDIRSSNSRTGQNVDGTIVLSQTGGRGVEMTNVFSSTPQVRCYRGAMDASGTLFNLTQFDPPGESRKINLHILANGSWTADVWSNGQLVESYTFSHA